MPKYVLCKFRPEDSRSYTYLFDGHACEVGDEVKVPDNRSDGWKRVTVVGFSDEEPKFPCKPILGLAPPPEPKPEADLVALGDMWSHDIDPEELF